MITPRPIMEPRPPGFRLPVGEGVELRLLRPEQAVLVYLEIERSRAHLRRWLPWVDATRSARDCRPHLERSWRGYNSGEGFSFGLFDGEALAGVVGYHGFDFSNRVTSIGYWLGERFQGRGLMTRAVAACVEYAFEERRMNRLSIRCAVGNERSRAIPQRLGFSFEGTQREAEWLYDRYVDLEVYAMLATAWEQRRARANGGA